MLLLSPLGRATGEQHQLLDDFRHVLGRERRGLIGVSELLRPPRQRGAQERDHLVAELRVIVSKLGGVLLVRAHGASALIVLPLGCPIALPRLLSNSAEAHAMFGGERPDRQIPGHELLLELVVVNLRHGVS